MSGDFFDPTPDEQVFVLVQSATLRQAERLVESCEHCNEEGAQIPFATILDRVTGPDPSVTDYILEEPASVRTADGRLWKRRWLNPSNADEDQHVAIFSQPKCRQMP